MPDADTIIGIAFLVIAIAVVVRVVLDSQFPERPDESSQPMPDNVTIPAERPAASPRDFQSPQPGADNSTEGE